MKNSGLRSIFAGVLLITGCGSHHTVDTTCTVASPQEFVYQVNAQNGTTVSMFTLNACTGMLSASTPASVSTGVLPGQQGAEQMVVDPLGRFAYVANLVSNSSDQATIGMFTINGSTGLLTPTSPPTVPTGFLPQGIAIDPNGKFVYTANSDDDTVSMFTVNQTTGVLTPTTPPTVAAATGPVAISIDPTGRFAYVASRIGQGISTYTIGPDGVLTPTTPAKLNVGDPFSVTIDRAGKFVYVPSNSNNSILQASMDKSTGVLTPLSAGAVSTGQGPTEIALDPSGKFSYVTNRDSNTLSLYNVDAVTGALTPISAMPTIPTGSLPFRILFNRSGKFLYVVNEQSATSVFTVNPDGTLKAAGTTGIAALSMAFVTAQ